MVGSPGKARQPISFVNLIGNISNFPGERQQERGYMPIASTLQPAQTAAEYFKPVHQAITRRDYAQRMQEVRRHSDLSDGAKLTYQELVAYDFQDRERGICKGYVWPSIATLAEVRGKNERTIRGHLQELVEAGLITRERRRNTTSLLHFQNVTSVTTEAQKVMREEEHDHQESPSSTTAKIRRSQTGSRQAGHSVTMRPQRAFPERQKSAIAYIDETTESMKLQQTGDVVVKTLERLQIAPQKARQLVATYPPGQIKQKIALLRQRLARTSYGGGITNPAGWLVKAIEHDYRVESTALDATRPLTKRVYREEVSLDANGYANICFVELEPEYTALTAT
jgi:DNA-binding MarR family transcriptional regulator